MGIALLAKQGLPPAGFKGLQGIIVGLEKLTRHREIGKSMAGVGG